MNKFGNALLLAGVFCSGVAHAAHTVGDTLIVDSWIKIRENGTTATNNEWVVEYLSGPTLKLRSESPSTAQVSLYIDNSAFTSPVGTLSGARDATGLQTWFGLKNEQANWVVRSMTNITTNPKLFQTEFFSDGSVIGGFYGANFGLGTTSPSAKLYVAGTTVLAGTVSVSGEVSGAGVTVAAAANKVVKTTSTGKLHPSLMRVARAGDISMGTFTQGTEP